MRRICTQLNVPTRHGEIELYLLSTVAEIADVPMLALLYSQRSTIEREFLHQTVQLRCEVNILNYPTLPLFGLACAMVVFNVLGVFKATLRAGPGEQMQACLSRHLMPVHMRDMAQSLKEIVEPQDWVVFQLVNTVQMAQWLLAQAALILLKRQGLRPQDSRPVRSQPAHGPRVLRLN